MKTSNNNNIETIMGATLTWTGASNLLGEYMLESYTKAYKGKIEVWLRDMSDGHIITMDLSRRTLGDLQTTGEHRLESGTTIRVKQDAKRPLWISVDNGVAGDIFKEWEVAVQDLQRHVYNTLQDCCGGEVHRESATRYQVYYKKKNDWDVSEVIPFDPTKPDHREAYKAQRDLLKLPELPALEPASGITEQREKNDACISSAESRRDSTNCQITDVPAADLVWDEDKEGCKVWGNIELHAKNLESIGGKKGRVTFKHNGTGRKMQADCYTFKKADKEAALGYFNKVMDRIANDFNEAWQADETHTREYREGQNVVTIYGRGTVTVGGDGLKEPIAVRLDTPTYNYTYSLVGTPQTGVLVNAQQIASIELPEPPAEIVIGEEPTLESVGEIKAVCIEGVSLTAEKRTKWAKNFGDIIREHTTMGKETQYNHDCGCICVNVAYRNDSDKPEDMTYCVSWYKWLDIETEKRELVECENGIRLEQAARAMADFHLLADAGLTLQQILYPAA